MREKDIEKFIQIKEYLDKLRECQRFLKENNLESAYFSFRTSQHPVSIDLPTMFTKHFMKSIDEIILNLEVELKQC